MHTTITATITTNTAKKHSSHIAGRSTIFFLIFVTFVFLYHPLATYLQFGTQLIDNARYLAFFRDIGRWIVVGCIGLSNFGSTISFIKKYKVLLLASIGLVVSALWSCYIFDMPSSQIILGIKHVLLPLFLCVSALFLGYIRSNHDGRASDSNDKVYEQLPRIVIGICILGALRQGAKHLFPEFFYGLGYGPVGDRVATQAPPLYYRTGPGGLPRFSGIFAGPNNFGYFLSFVGPIVAYIVSRSTMQLRKKILIGAIIILSGLATMSRALLLARLSACCIYFLLSPKIRRYSRLIIGGAILGVGGLSIYKRGSTIERLSKRQASITAIQQSPFVGYGLGYSGPSAHYSMGLIPENMYLQVWLDLGIGGLGLRLIVLGLILYFILKKSSSPIDNTEHPYPHIHISIALGLIGLLVSGLFLHSFEDSTVNYAIVFVVMFLGRRGIM